MLFHFLLSTNDLLHQVKLWKLWWNFSMIKYYVNLNFQKKHFFSGEKYVSIWILFFWVITSDLFLWGLCCCWSPQCTYTHLFYSHTLSQTALYMENRLLHSYFTKIQCLALVFHQCNIRGFSHGNRLPYPLPFSCVPVS